MIFPDKPRPPWTKSQPLKLAQQRLEPQPVTVEKSQRPRGYWRERIEFALIVVGMYFWIQFWDQYR
jgi:hypothetical protein